LELKEEQKMMVGTAGFAAKMNLPYFKDVVLPQLWERLTQIVTAPVKHQDMIWIVIPLITALLLMEFYFGRYKREELGWNSALANSLVLIFVSIDLFRRIYGDFVAISTSTLTQNMTQNLVALAIAIEGFIIMFFDFFHMLPKRMAFMVSSALPINLTAYFAIVFVYSKMPFDIYTIIAFFIVFIVLIALFGLIHLIEPEYREQYRRTKLSMLFTKLFGPLEKKEKNKAQKEK
jgi:hypothetical protein